MGVLFLDPLDDQLKILDPGYLSFPVLTPCSVKPRLFGHSSRYRDLEDRRFDSESERTKDDSKFTSA